MFKSLLPLLSSFLMDGATPLNRSQDYLLLKAFEPPKATALHEVGLDGEYALPPLEVPLTGFYDDFAADGRVDIYYGLGAEREVEGFSGHLVRMLQAVTEMQQLPLSEFEASEGKVSFLNHESQLRYHITIGSERDEFQAAFSRYEVVMYGGHSRHGRGPAFDDMTHYFRMGSKFPTVEVDVRNPYFVNEQPELTQLYPTYPVEIGGERYQYQYRGQQDKTSYLPETSFTKNIRGYDADLRETVFSPKKQILWFHSCSNALYFKQPLRSLFPDPTQKFIFGTRIESYDVLAAVALFITSLSQQIESPLAIIDELNEVDDCFTSY